MRRHKSRFFHFERRILWTMLAVALVPLAIIFVLGGVALRDTYAVGVNGRVGTALEEKLQLHRDHIAVHRANATLTVNRIAADADLRAAIVARDRARVSRRLGALLNQHRNVRSIQLRGSVAAQVAHGARPGRPLTRSRTLPGNHVLRVVLVADENLFTSFQRTGRFVAVYNRLRESAAKVSRLYLYVFASLALAAALIVLVVGITTLRRLTQRVSRLAEATDRVAAGDLSVRVPVPRRDQIGELTRAFNHMVQELEESRERISYLQRVGAWQDIARSLAHEIKNPLTPIKLAVQEVQEAHTPSGGRDTQEAYALKLKEARVIVEEEIDALERLVREFSAFGRLPQVTLARASLGTFVRENTTAWNNLVQSHAHYDDTASLTVAGAEVDSPVMLDAMLMKRCVDNLILNAVQAAAHAGFPCRITVGLSEQKTGVDLFVEDEGPGLPKGDAAKVFTPYFTTKAQGTGLGLAIVKKIVFEHNAHIEVAHKHPHGARFVIRFKDPSATSRS